MKNDIDLVVFDMDDVLVHLDRVRRLQCLSEMTGRQPQILQSTLWEADFESGAERGQFADGADYLATFNHLIGSQLSREQWIEARRAAMTPIPDMLQLAASLRESCKIAMLTNNGPLLLESLPELVPDIWKIFGENAHASCQFRARKPEPEVFKRLLADYQVAAERAIFIDDTPLFVEGARAVGMNAIHFTGVLALKQSLSAIEGLSRGSVPGPGFTRI